MNDNHIAAAHIDSLLERLQSDAAARHRIKGWQQLIHWNIDGRDYFWHIDQGNITSCSDLKQRPDIAEMLRKNAPKDRR